MEQEDWNQRVDRLCNVGGAKLDPGDVSRDAAPIDAAPPVVLEADITGSRASIEEHFRRGVCDGCTCFRADSEGPVDDLIQKVRDGDHDERRSISELPWPAGDVRIWSAFGEHVPREHAALRLCAPVEGLEIRATRRLRASIGTAGQDCEQERTPKYFQHPVP